MGLDTTGKFMRQRSVIEQAARGTMSHADSIKRMMDQIDGSAGVLRHLQRDPMQDTVSQLLKRIRDVDNLRATAQAINEAHRNRDFALRALGSTDLLRQRDLALTAYSSGISRTAEILARNRDLFASPLSANRSIDEISGLASSIVRQIESLRLSVQLDPNWTEPLAVQYAEQFGIVRDVVEEFEAAETNEQRSALLLTLLMALVAMMRAFAGNTKNQVLGIGALALLGVVADVVSLLPHDTPGMPPAQVAMIKDTRDEVGVLREELKAYRLSEHELDEKWVAELPRAELKRNAMIRNAAGRDGRVLAKLETEAPLAIIEPNGAWKQVAYRDPLTGELTQGWVYGPLVRLLD